LREDRERYAESDPRQRTIKMRGMLSDVGATRERLAGWAGTLSAWLKEGLDVYCYFDNDQAGFAAQDALRLRQMMLEG
jgi:uncharacterized protein YecE (DUF72 family)